MAPPTLDEMAQVLNAKAARVWQLSTENATVSAGDLLTLRANISLERPTRFRLQGKAFGPAVDLGSNDELIWFWAKSNPDNAVYYARHDQLGGVNGAPIPIEATWLIDAFGLVELRPNDLHEGPYDRGNGQIEIRSTLRHAHGINLYRSIVVDSTYGWVTEQRISDGSGQVLAEVYASDHRYDHGAAVSLPHRIRISLPPVQVSFQMEVSSYLVNQLREDPATLWTMPNYDGYRIINLAEEGLPGSVVSPTSADPLYEATNRHLYRPRYRGSNVR